MNVVRMMPVVVLACVTPLAAAQISPVIQERSVQTSASVSSGTSDTDFNEALTFGPFDSSIASSVAGAGGAAATGGASQISFFGAGSVFSTLGATGNVQTGSTFITGESDAQSNLLFIFNLANPTQINFQASGKLEYYGRNPDGEPSDLFGISRVRLLDAATSDVIAGFQLMGDAATDSVSFLGVLPAGQYVILASTQLHAFSADLLGPPARSGSGAATASLQLTVVPSPGALGLLGAGALVMFRRRRLR